MSGLKYIYLSIILLFSFNCNTQESAKIDSKETIKVGAEHTDLYFPILKDKRVGLAVNHTSRIGNVHLVDSLVSSGFQVTKIFAPEHGYKGEADAGEYIADGKKDEAQIISLYGTKKKPSSEDLSDVDILVFDIQDVGVRFYTYISTLHYVMEAAAENDLPVIVLDRPNPNGFYVDGPVLNTSYSSFVGMHPVPVVYGLTIGEYATMINGEEWLKDGLKADLEVVKLTNYDHTMTYDLPIKPSPNLPNLRSILLYPSICFFEGTKVSVGRGTTSQFQVIGHPALESRYEFSFTPVSREGAKYPKHQDKMCYGLDLTSLSVSEIKNEGRLNLSYVLRVYNDFNQINEEFFIDNNFFDKLAGGSRLKAQILDKIDEESIRASWEEDLAKYKLNRKKYLLYTDFE